MRKRASAETRVDRRARHDDRAGLHRLARPFPRGRLRALVRAAARRQDAGASSSSASRRSRRRFRPARGSRDGDWDHELWGGELPRRDWIDAVTPDHPVWVNRLDGHMSLANGAALAAAGVTKETSDVDGGDDRARRARRADRHPQGQRASRSSHARSRRSLRRARATARSTPRCDTSASAASRPCITWGRGPISRSSSARTRAARLGTRIYAAVPLATWERLRDTRRGARVAATHWLRIGALKGFVDGSLGSHTAAMLEPFDDAPNDSRPLREHAGRSLRWTSGADKAGLHMIVHAIGDRAIRDAARHLRARRRARTARATAASASSTRSTSRRADIPRFAALGVIASMQPYHAIDDGRWAERVIGAERAKIDVRVPVAARCRARARVRQRLVRRAADAARGDLRRGHAPHARRRESGRLGTRSSGSRSRRRCAPTRATPRTRRSPRRTRGSWRAACSRTS